MSESFTLDRIVRHAVELRSIAHHRASETMEQLDEAVHYWNDQRGREFARGHEEPMRQLVPGLQDTVRGIGETVAAIAPLAYQTETLARRAQVDHETVAQHERDCLRHLDTGRYYIAEADQLSASCRQSCAALRARSASLGDPPI